MLLTSVIIFTIYLTYIVLKYGVQSSISASWYKFSGAEWMLFTLWTWGTGLPLVAMDLGTLVTMGGVSLMFVGVAGAFRDNRLTLFLHMAFTYLAIILLCVALWQDGQ